MGRVGWVLRLKYELEGRVLSAQIMDGWHTYTAKLIALATLAAG